MQTVERLKQELKRIDGKSYGAYKDLTGAYELPKLQLFIDQVQGDPFASPSRVRLKIQENVHQFPREWYDTKEKKIALEDYLLRRLTKRLNQQNRSVVGSGKSGLITTCRPGQEVLEQIAVLFQQYALEVRLEVGFPARGRTILARELEKILLEDLPALASSSLLYPNLDKNQAISAIRLAQNQAYIREQLNKKNLVAFVADGAILPRSSGVSELPLKTATPFSSPESLRMTMELPFGGPITGMGVPNGITVIAGGGYHGKSTLLRALETGVYNHVKDDGREYVIAEETGVKIRAEDGRCVFSCNLSPFIRNLPNGQDTVNFATENASGSTSQAANVVEAIEAGAKAFFIDEDTSATNFMIRDEVMSRLVAEDKEPITPFVRKIRGIHDTFGISTVIVVGSSGDYLAAADTVLQLDQYQVVDVTKKAEEICKAWGLERFDAQTPMPKLSFRRPLPVPKERGRRESPKIKVNGLDGLTIERDTIDLRYLEQLRHTGQLSALGYMLAALLRKGIDGKKTVVQLVDQLYKQIGEQGLLSVVPSGYHGGHPVMVRRQELFACINRFRSLV